MLDAQKGSCRIEFGLCGWTVVCFDSICAVEREKKLRVVALNGPLCQVRSYFVWDIELSLHSTFQPTVRAPSSRNIDSRLSSSGLRSLVQACESRRRTFLLSQKVGDPVYAHFGVSIASSG